MPVSWQIIVGSRYERPTAHVGQHTGRTGIKKTRRKKVQGKKSQKEIMKHKYRRRTEGFQASRSIFQFVTNMILWRGKFKQIKIHETHRTNNCRKKMKKTKKTRLEGKEKQPREKHHKNITKAKPTLLQHKALTKAASSQEATEWKSKPARLSRSSNPNSRLVRLVVGRWAGLW